MFLNADASLLEFVIDENQAYFWTTSTDDEGKLRDSIVFRFKPVKK